MGKTMNLARKVRDEVDAALANYDILITPTMVCLPQRIDTYDQSMGPLAKMAFAAGVGLNTCPYSVVSAPPNSIRSIAKRLTFHRPDIRHYPSQSASLRPKTMPQRFCPSECR